jgi:hypothetical protein
MHRWSAQEPRKEKRESVKEEEKKKENKIRKRK